MWSRAPTFSPVFVGRPYAESPILKSQRQHFTCLYLGRATHDRPFTLNEYEASLERAIGTQKREAILKSRNLVSLSRDGLPCASIQPLHHRVDTLCMMAE